MGSKAAKETPEERATRITAEEQIERKKEIILGAIILGIILFVFISSIFFLKYYYPILETRAFFGDSNGTVNTLFSALAFGGIIYTILLQRKELKLQREELRETKEEMRRSAEAQELSNNHFNEQLRLNILPIFDYNLIQSSANYISDTRGALRITNLTNNAVSLDVIITIFFSNGKKYKFNKYYRIFQKNEYVQASFDIYKTEDLDVQVMFKDIQTRTYKETMFTIREKITEKSGVVFSLINNNEVPEEIMFPNDSHKNVIYDDKGPDDFTINWTKGEIDKPYGTLAQGF